MEFIIKDTDRLHLSKHHKQVTICEFFREFRPYRILYFFIAHIAIQALAINFSCITNAA
jgi:hypothetical protein